MQVKMILLVTEVTVKKFANLTPNAVQEKSLLDPQASQPGLVRGTFYIRRQQNFWILLPSLSPK